MTYLQLVNNVLKRLREDTVSTVEQNAYSSLIGALVNDAKGQIENAWDWSQLTTKTTLSTAVATIVNTGLEDSDDIESIKVGDYWLKNVPFDYLSELEPKTGNPEYYAISGSDSTGQLEITLYPAPASTVDVEVYYTSRAGELSADADTIRIPHMPVMHLALALAARERGENGGTTTQEFFAIAKRHLEDAISYDAAKTPSKVIWYEV